MSDGIMSGVNCTRACAEGERAGERAHEQRLAEARHALDEHVPRRHERDEHLLDDRGLADHRLLDRRAKQVEASRGVQHPGLIT